MNKANPKELHKIATARQLCEKLDIIAEQLLSLTSFVEVQKKKFDRKKRLFTGKNILLAYIIVMIACFLPLSVVSFIFPDLKLGIFVPAIGAIVTIISKSIYTKKKVPVYTNVYEQLTIPKIKEIEHLKEEFYVYIDDYEEAVDKIPEDLRYTIALDFMHEAIRQGYVADISKAVEFYRERLAYIRSEQTDDSKKLCDDIKISEKAMKQRVEMIKKSAINFG